MSRYDLWDGVLRAGSPSPPSTHACHHLGLGCSEVPPHSPAKPAWSQSPHQAYFGEQSALSQSMGSQCPWRSCTITRGVLEHGTSFQHSLRVLLSQPGGSIPVTGGPAPAVAGGPVPAQRQWEGFPGPKGSQPHPRGSQPSRSHCLGVPSQEGSGSHPHGPPAHPNPGLRCRVTRRRAPTGSG